MAVFDTSPPHNPSIVQTARPNAPPPAVSLWETVLFCLSSASSASTGRSVKFRPCTRN